MQRPEKLCRFQNISDRVQEYLSELVRIPSVSKRGHVDSAKEIADYIDNHLAQLNIAGLTKERIGHNIIARYMLDKPNAKNLAVFNHMDTVDFNADEKIGKILKNLGFDITKSSANNFVVGIPQYRHDIVNKQDIVEEIVRLIGIDNIPSKPFTFTEENKLQDDYFEYKKKSIFRHRAAATGFFESGAGAVVNVKTLPLSSGIEIL